MKQVELEAELTRLLEQERAPDALVGALREHVPDANELGSLASRLALQGVPLTPAAVPAAVPAAGKAWLGLAAGAVTVAGAWLLLRAEPTPSAVGSSMLAPVASVTTTMPAAAPSSAVPPVARGAAERGAPEVAAPAGSAAATDEAPAVASAAEPAPDATPPPTTTSIRAAAAAPPAPAATAQPQAAPPTTPHAGLPAVTGGSEPAFEAPSAPASQPSEIELLREARLSLRSSPARALELSEQHARSYPAGKLVQERELLAITALVSLGRRTAALSRAARFEQNFPTSPYRKQLGALLK